MKKQGDTRVIREQQKPGAGYSVIVPDTGKRGVQPIGTVKPFPPRPTPPIVHVRKDS